MAKKKKKDVSVVNQMQQNLAISQAALNSLALGYDFEHRAIFLFGPIDKMAAYRFIAGFKFMDRYEGPIHVLLSSEGGDTEAGFAIYECLRTANNPVVIEAMGIVASAAVPILLAGTVRFLNPETSVMVHNMSYEIEGMVSTPVVHSLSRDAEKINQRYHEIISGRTGKAMKDVKKWCDEETTFSCADAIKHGFADKVLDQRALPRSFEDGMAEVRGQKQAEVVQHEEKKPKAKKAKKR